MIQEDHLKFLKLAIANSQKSMEEGNFPAGAVVVKAGEIVSSAISVPYPGLFHADSRAVTDAFNKIGPLHDATLYIGVESCLMCIGIAYWAGIRKVVYAVSKAKVSGDYYETPLDTTAIVDSFNEPIERIHIADLEDQALAIIHAWEKKYLHK